MKYFRARLVITALCGSVVFSSLWAEEKVGIWMKFECDFISGREYDNPLYDVSKFRVNFVSPSGRVKKINGFWDGGCNWKVRFCPDETGLWNYAAECSDTTNSGLHNIKGSFECIKHDNRQDIYSLGAIKRPKGAYHLTYADGTPFFWTACTAWNGALRSAEEEWEYYLENRAGNGYNVIQLVTTQWRGCEADRLGQVAFEGSGKIKINPVFFQRLDKKIDRVNAHGLVAAPVLLWALPWGPGRELSPGYYLPENEAILLARYMVARYGGNHVVWILGGDGAYVGEFEQRWKKIGQGVFGEEHPGLVTQHSHGRSWIGREYADQDWLDIVGYQSSHGKNEEVVNWITKGPVPRDWQRIPARPIINLEPAYEEIFFRITARDVRNACYWSVMAAPVAGITYGANGIWPWLRKGEKILNHESLDKLKQEYHTWKQSIDFPGSMQVGYLAGFFRGLEWWRLKPAQELLANQPGDNIFNNFVSVVSDDAGDLIVAYLPGKMTATLYNQFGYQYKGSWFDPANNSYHKAEIEQKDGLIEAEQQVDQDMLLVLHKIEN